MRHTVPNILMASMCPREKGVMITCSNQLAVRRKRVGEGEEEKVDCKQNERYV